MVIVLPELLQQIVGELDAAGHRSVVVGGAVRDALLGIEPKDFDIEVYGIAYDQLAGLIARHGRVDLVGKSFGVVKLHVHQPGGIAQYDFSVPRRDSKFGIRHRDFHATFDEGITPQEAASRRDFTINAIGWDPVAGRILDYFGGVEDLRHRVLRATGPAFSEDPLRVLRGMQLACRFNLELAPETAARCQTIVDQYDTIAGERVAEEFMKWAVKSSRPGRIGGYLKASGWQVHFPEIAALAGTPQDPYWHPEGDVGTHTGYVLDAAARVADRDGLAGDDRAVLLFAALCHDFAKPKTTALRERGGEMRWTSWGHEQEGGPMARAFLGRIHIKAAIVDQVAPLVENHLAHSSIGDRVTPRAVRRLAMRLAPASITRLAQLTEADHSGRPPLEPGLPEGMARIQEMAASQEVEEGPQPPLILGRHVLRYFDDRPGPHIGVVTRAAYEAQADGAFSDEAEALAWLERYMADRDPGLPRATG